MMYIYIFVSLCNWLTLKVIMMMIPFHQCVIFSRVRSCLDDITFLIGAYEALRSCECRLRNGTSLLSVREYQLHEGYSDHPSPLIHEATGLFLHRVSSICPALAEVMLTPRPP